MKTEPGIKRALQLASWIGEYPSLLIVLSMSLIYRIFQLMNGRNKPDDLWLVDRKLYYYGHIGGLAVI